MRYNQENNEKKTKAQKTNDIVSTKERWRKPAFIVTTSAELTRHITLSARSGGCSTLSR